HNVVNEGARIGLSVSNKPVKNNVFWGYNTVRNCIQWGAQLQGETGGIAQHYFYRCVFESIVRGDERARYKNDDGHGFRTNGNCRDLVFEECEMRNNGGYGAQLGGANVDALSFVRCAITGNALAAVTGPRQHSALEFVDCRVTGNKSDGLPEARPFPARPPTADFQAPDSIRARQPAAFRCTSVAAAGEIAERLWDFDHGIPEVVAEPTHVYDKPGEYRVTLIVWDDAGRGARAEKTVRVLAPRR
ncbi:MAG: PKD domain-containing protein, partial [Armatimonadota bacterium]